MQPLWDLLTEIQHILERTEGRAITISVNESRTVLTWRVDNMPHHTIRTPAWQFEVEIEPRKPEGDRLSEAANH